MAKPKKQWTPLTRSASVLGGPIGAWPHLFALLHGSVAQRWQHRQRTGGWWIRLVGVGADIAGSLGNAACLAGLAVPCHPAAGF